MVCKVRLRSILAVFAMLMLPIGAQGCAAVAGAGAAAGGYETKQASEMEQLEEDYESGKITREEYEARKEQIDEASITQ